MSKNPNRSEFMERIAGVSADFSQRAGKVTREQIYYTSGMLQTASTAVASYQMPERLSKEAAYASIKNAYDQVHEYEKVHPVPFKIARTVIIGAGSAAAAPFVAQAMIAPVGFVGPSVAPGTTAAAIQSTWYGAVVPANSWFAWTTSLGAGGYAAPQLSWATGVGYMGFEALKASISGGRQQQGAAGPPQA